MFHQTSQWAVVFTCLLACSRNGQAQAKAWPTKSHLGDFRVTMPSEPLHKYEAHVQSGMAYPMYIVDVNHEKKMRFNVVTTLCRESLDTNEACEKQLEKVISKVSKNTQIIKQEAFIDDDLGKPAVEFTLKFGQTYFRHFAFQHGDLLYQLFLQSDDKELINSKLADDFFASFKLTGNKPNWPESKRPCRIDAMFHHGEEFTDKQLLDYARRIEVCLATQNEDAMSKLVGPLQGKRILKWYRQNGFSPGENAKVLAETTIDRAFPKELGYTEKMEEPGAKKRPSVSLVRIKERAGNNAVLVFCVRSQDKDFTFIEATIGVDDSKKVVWLDAISSISLEPVSDFIGRGMLPKLINDLDSGTLAPYQALSHAMTLAQTGDFAGAKQQLQKVLTRRVGRVRVAQLLKLILLAQAGADDEYDTERASFKKEFPNQFYSSYVCAMAFRHNKDYKRAAEAITDAEEVYGPCPAFDFFRGELAWDQDENEQAYQLFKKAFEAQPETRAFANFACATAQDRKDFELAVKCVDAMLRYHSRYFSIEKVEANPKEKELIESDAYKRWRASL